ncbi:hypothetical protein LINPERHAP2_LOCUS35075, partial [Linum perenne]
MLGPYSQIAVHILMAFNSSLSKLASFFSFHIAPHSYVFFVNRLYRSQAQNIIKYIPMSIPMDDILALVARMDWFAYTIYKLNSRYLIFQSFESTQFAYISRLLICNYHVHHRLTTIILCIAQMMRSVYLFVAPCVDQQSKLGHQRNPTCSIH